MFLSIISFLQAYVLSIKKKRLRSDVSHANDVVRYVIDSGVAVKWLLQHLRRTNVTYNGYTEMVCDDCNVYCNTGVLDRRRPITKYV